MSAQREWKPGDVAKVRDERGVTRVAVRTNLIDSRHHWAYDEVGIGRILADARPLVVIDPEDREQVERLVKALDDAPVDYDDGGDVREMQAALRSLIEPPKPEEPQGFGAVVEDSKGRCWTRAYLPGCGNGSKGAWYCGDLRSRYDDIAVLRILSEGVQP